MTTVPDDILRRALDPPTVGWDARDGYRDAAVLAPLVTRSGADFLLFTMRRDDLPHHAGQISFPGGAREGDEAPLDCALRESHEELGVRPDDVLVLGSLPARQSSAGFRVQVFVGRIPAGVELRPDPREVARVLELPVAALRVAGRWHDHGTGQTGQTGPGPGPAPAGVRGPHFEYLGDTLWGLTARFTLDLLARLDPDLRRSREPREPREPGEPGEPRRGV